MKVSFSIPAHNEEAIIGKCIESVLAEIHRSGVPAEVVVVNNASTDRTREVASQYPGVRVVDEMEKGLTKARAAGMHVADGDIIANIDADTMVPPGWLTTVRKRFSANPNLVALSGPYIYYDLSFFERTLTTLFYALGYVTYIIFHYVLRTGGMLQGGNFVIRRDAFEKVGGFDKSIAFYGEDTDVARRLTRVGEVVWTWSLPMYTSGRRIKAEGIITVGFRYTLNYLAVNVFGKPATKIYQDIRT